jgi:hypothetical protein
MRLFLSFTLAISSLSLASAQDHGWSNQSAINIARPASSGSSSNALLIRIRDKCDPTTFNAILGLGACVGDGNVTFDEFNAELAEDQKVGAWRFNPDQTDATSGQLLTVENRGGETHTFTNVAEFGGGAIVALNALSGNPEPRPECVNLKLPDPAPGVHAFNAGVVPIAHSATMPGPALLDKEGHEQKFQCCIHPWMRLTVKIQGAH